MKKLLTCLLLLAGPVLAVNKFDDVRVVKSLTLDEGIVFTIGPTAGEALKVALGIDQYDEQLALKAPIAQPTFQGPVTINGDLGVTGEAGFANGNFTIDTSGNVDAQRVTSTYLVSEGDLGVTGQFNLGGEAVMQSTLDVAGNTTIGGDISTPGDVTAGSGLSAAGGLFLVSQGSGDTGISGTLGVAGPTSLTSLTAESANVTGPITGVSFSATGSINAGTTISAEGNFQTSANLSVYGSIDAGDYRFGVDNDGNVRSYGGISSAGTGPDYAALGSDVNVPRVSLGNSSIAAEFGINLTGTVDAYGLPTGHWGLAAPYAYGLVLKTPSTIDLISNGSSVTINGGRVSSVNATYQDANSILNAGASDLRYVQSSVTNAQAITQEGVAFDGTAGATFSTPIPSQSSSAAYSFWINVPESVPETQIIYGRNAADVCDGVLLGADKKLYVTILGLSGNATCDTVPSTGWHFITVSIDRGVSVSYFFDGVFIQTVGFGNVPTNPVSYFGGDVAGLRLAAAIARASVYNKKFTNAEAAALYARGGIPLPEELGASQTVLNAAAWTPRAADGGGGGTMTSANGATISVTGITSWRQDNANPLFSAKKGERYRLTGTRVSGGTSIALCNFWNGATVSTTSCPINSGTDFSYEFVVGVSDDSTTMNMGTDGTYGGVSLTNLKLVKVGTLFAMDDGSRSAGFQVADISGNGHHLNLPATGVKIVHPDPRGGVLRGRTTQIGSEGGSGPSSLIGRIPLNARIEFITAKSVIPGVTHQITVGNVANGTQIVIPGATLPPVAFTDFTLATRYTTTRELWATSDYDDSPIDWTVRWTPMSGPAPAPDLGELLPAP